MGARFILLREATLAGAQACAAEAAGVGRRCLKGGSGAGGGRSERGVGLPEAASRSLVRRALATEDRASSHSTATCHVTSLVT